MYSSKVSLKLHIKVIHDGIKKHKCQICNKAYRLSGELNRHVEIQHENIRNFECDICKRYFGMRAQLMSHIKTVHDKKRDFKCKECSAAFGTKGELNRHTKIIHNNIRDFVCTICNGAYGTRYQYYNTFWCVWVRHSFLLDFVVQGRFLGKGTQTALTFFGNSYKRSTIIGPTLDWTKFLFTKTHFLSNRLTLSAIRMPSVCTLKW